MKLARDERGNARTCFNARLRYDDLAVARDRAMSAEGRNAAKDLDDAVNGAVAHQREAAAVQAQFERAVETFADDGFRYRRGVGAPVLAALRRIRDDPGGAADRVLPILDEYAPLVEA